MFAIAGPPGSGKSTQLQVFSSAGYGIASIGDLLRQHAPPNVLAQISCGQLVDLDYTNSLMDQALTHLRTSHGDTRVVLDGFPRAVYQAQWLLEEYRAPLAQYVVLMAPEAILLERLMARGRNDDNHEAIQNRLNVFVHNMPLLLDYLNSQRVEIYKINAEQSTNSITKDIKEALKLV